MALADYALITMEELNSYFEEAVTDANEITFWERIINAASLKAEGIAQRKLKERQYTKRFDGTGTRRLMLPEYPVNAITSLNIDTSRVFDVTTESTSFFFYPDEGIVELIYEIFPEVNQSIEITFRAGFINVPEDLKEAVVECCLHSANRFAGDGARVGVKAIKGADGSTEYEMQIPFSARRVFESYRREPLC